MKASMSLSRLVFASLRHHRQTNLAVALGVAAGTAVLTGALLVGDSMRGSLRHLTLDRLGRIDEVLAPGTFFREKLAGELAGEPGFRELFADAVPAVMLQVGVRNDDRASPRRATRVNLIGCDERFWRLGSGGPSRQPERREVVLNRPLADRLGVGVGATVLVQLPATAAIPAESLLGRKDAAPPPLRCTVGEIIPAEGLGRFSMRPSQQPPDNLYVSLETLQAGLDQTGRVNAILVAGDDDVPSPETDRRLQAMLRPTLADLGLTLEKTPLGYFNITSDRLMLPPAAVEEIVADLTGGGDGRFTVQPALTYLANTIACGHRTIPYSTIAAIDFAEQPPLGPLLTRDGRPIAPLADDQIVLNSWAAAQLRAAEGDPIRVTYFEPETTHGEFREKTVAMKLAAVAELAGAADDRDFTPKVPGITDQLTMTEWDPPFPFDAKRVRTEDEEYWNDHGPTPKAFVSLATGRRLWASRFGGTTSLRIAAPAATTVEQLRDRLTLDPAAMGFAFQPVKRQGLAASSGATPFDVLFLSFSFFLILAAVMLVLLMFRLGIDRRASELGTLLALGFSRRKVARLLLAEGLAVALAGSAVGAPIGLGYAALMVLGLRTWWLGAVVTPFVQLHLTATSLVVGFAAGAAMAWAAILWAVWRTRHLAVRALLAGQTSETIASPPGRSRWAGWIALVVLVAAAAFGVMAGNMREDIRAGAFFGVGAMVLGACLAIAWSCLRSGATGPAVAAGRGNVARLAVRNAARNPGRSAATIGLVASACFLIIAVSAFRVDPAGQAPAIESGNGGLALVAQSDLPIYADLNAPAGRAGIGFPPKDSQELDDARVFALRVESGDDATCLNLYQARRPRVLGLPERFIDRGGFAWAASAADTPEEKQNPWLLLDRDVEQSDGVPVVPVVLEYNTAMYALHLYDGVGATYDIADGQVAPLRLKVVGLLANSIFQGDLLVSEASFLRFFPDVSGYRFFLVEAPEGKAGPIENVLGKELGDYGFSCETTQERLAQLFAVQNTYLSTFQSLGGLGLLLGTVGLAAVQLRNVLERRGELALLRAIGFRGSTLAVMVLLENGFLLTAGLGAGVVAAVVAVLPHLLARSASIPWASLAATLALVFVVGVAASTAAVRAVLRTSLLGTLREDRGA